VVVAVWRGEFHSRAQVALDKLAPDGIASFSGDDWRLSVRPARIAGADWLRADVTALSGEDLTLAQTVTAFFRNDDSLQHLWTGASDRHERRFDACALDTTARFSLSRNGDLVRARRTKRTLGDPVGVDGETLAATKAKCVAPPPVRDTFPVADDGLSTDVTVDEALRARARANRLLYIRAPESDEAFAKLVSDSFSLLEPLTQAVATGKPLDPDQDVAQVAIPGAFAYALEGGLRASLAWKHLRAVAKPAARRLLAALEDFDRDYLGAWIEPLTDLGGCHNPAQAAQPLAKLVDAWLDAPVSAREAFRDYLAGQLRDMATNGCLCAPRSALDKLRGALEANAVLLERLPEIGADPAQRLRALPTSPDTFFSCRGPH
jgi:hypothetical protein